MSVRLAAAENLRLVEFLGMSEAQLRAVMLNADEVALVCAEVLDVLELREQGQELLQFNLVDVTVDCVEGA